MIKNQNRLDKVEKTLVDWLLSFEKDYNYQLASEGVNIVIIEGLRTLELQKKYLAEGKSKTLKSKHLANKNGLSQAIDIAFEKNGKINWNDLKWWKLAGKHLAQYSKSKGIAMTWGGDWNKNGEHLDERFLDCPHYQIDTTPKEDEVLNVLIQKGDKGEIVKQIQTLLISHNFNLGKFGADGDYGDATVKAVEAFQKSRGLLVDGKVGFKTFNALKGV